MLLLSIGRGRRFRTQAVEVADGHSLLPIASRKQSRPASLRMQAMNDVVRCPIELTDLVAKTGYPHAIR
jgi:hypothetical protein